MIKAALIDIDNTLLDFDAYVRNAMKEGFEIFGLGTYDDSMFDVFKRINTELWQKIEEGSLTFEELLKQRWNRIFSVLNIAFDGCRFEKYFRGCLFDSAIPVKGAKRMLAYLKDRYILCVASNGPYKQQLNRLKRGEMLSYFDKFFISEKIGSSKPAAEFFSYCLSELNFDRKEQGVSEILPSEVIMIGDSLTSDIAGAVNFGIKTCFYDKNMSGNTDGLPVDYVVSRLDDIRGFL